MFFSDGRVFLPFSGFLIVLRVPPQRTLRLIASHLAKQLRKWVISSPPGRSGNTGFLAHATKIPIST